MLRRIFWLLALVTAGICGCHRKDAEEIKFGEIVSLTGKEAAWGQSSHLGAILAVEQLNGAGGLLGFRVALVSEDNQSKPGDTVTVARKLISRERVVGILGEDASARSLEAAPVCQAARTPMICSSNHAAITEVGDYIFRVTFITSDESRTLAKFARNSMKFRRMAILNSASTAYSSDLGKWFTADFSALGGSIVQELKYFEGDKDFKAQLTAIKAAGVDGIFVPAYYTEAALICAQARELGIVLPILGCGGWEAPELFTIGGKAVEGCYYVTAFSAENPETTTQKFIREFRARFPGREPDSFAGLRYDAVMMLAEAIRKAGSLEPSAIRDSLAATKDFPGATGMIALDSKRNASKAIVIVQVDKGKPKFVARIDP